MGSYTRVNSLRKLCILSQADGFAGEVGKPLPSPGGMYPAVEHLENKCGLVGAFDDLGIDRGIKPIAEGLFKGA